MKRSSLLKLLGLVFAFALVAASCGDDGASVREVGSASSSSGSGSGSGSSSASASASAPASGSSSSSGSASGSSSAPAKGGAEVTDDATAGEGGYDYASNVDNHRLLVLDMCDMNELLGASPIDFDAVADIYNNGKNAEKSDGSFRTLGGFASAEGKKHAHDTYYGNPASLDAFITSALEGTGMFAGESDGVRKQGVQKGMQNQALLAYVTHELNSAVAKAGDGNWAGAVHNWDEGWAFYHGANGGCGPYGTANKRGGNFGTLGSDGETAEANEAILGAMIAGRDALLRGNAGGAEAAANLVKRGVVITYSQAVIRYAVKVEADLAEGDMGKARIHQAEGLAFWRVLEPELGLLGMFAETIETLNSAYELENEPGSGASSDDIRTALYPVWALLEIGRDDIGSLQ